MDQRGATLTGRCRPAQEETEAGSEEGTFPGHFLPLGADLGSPEPLACAAWQLGGCPEEQLTWVIRKVLGLASFSLPVDDIEVHLHRDTDVLVPILRDLNKKHVLGGSSCHEFDHMQHGQTPTQIPSMSTQPALWQAVWLCSLCMWRNLIEGNLTFHPGKEG